MSTAIKYRADIDGLRAFAILSVFIFHLNPSWLYGGFIGVDVFFVISGYLITRIIIRENQQGNFSFVNFYARRVKRIFPVLFFVLAVVALMAVLSFPDITYKTFVTTYQYASAQFSNFFFAKEVDYFAEGNELQPLLHTWSLAVEEQFYLVWPLLIFLCYKLTKTEKRNAILFVFFAVMSLSFFTGYVLAYEAPQYAFYMFFSRAWEFCIGGIFALDLIPNIKNKRANNLTAVFGFVLMIASFIFIREGVDFVKGAVIVPVVGAGLIIYTAQQDETWISRMLSLKPVVYIGLISYSMYLWHWPVITFYKEIFEIKELSYDISLILVVITVILSLISYYLVEQPARKLKLKNGIALLLGALFIGLFIFSGLWLKEQEQAKWRVVKSLDKKGMAFSMRSCHGRKSYEAVPDKCTKGTKKRNPEVLLIGDSHAGRYRDMVYAWVKAKNLTMRHVYDSHCAIAFDRKGRTLPTFWEIREKNCEVLRSHVFQELEKENHYKYIFIGKRIDNFLNNENERREKNYESNLNEFIKYLQEKDKKVVILSQIPKLKYDPKKCFDKPFLKQALMKENCNTNLKEISIPFSSYPYKKEREIYDKLYEKYGVSTFNPWPYLPISIEQDGKLLYDDTDHLSGYGSRYLAPYFIEFMEKEFGDGSDQNGVSISENTKEGY